MDTSIDILANGGDLAQLMLNANFDHNALRPFVDEKGRKLVNNGKDSDGNHTVREVQNATLLKDEWIKLDEAVTKVARERLDFVTDLESMGLTYGLANAMGKTVLQYQNMSDITPAHVTMDGLNKSDSDRPVYDLTSMPIPIISKDLYFSAREVATSRNQGDSIDTSAAEMAARKVAETIESLHVGTFPQYQFAGANLYGMRNFPDRNQATVNDWTDASKTNEQRLADVLQLLDNLRDARRYGPYGIYLAANLERYLDEDFKANSDITLRERILKVGRDKGNNTDGKIRFVKALDYLNDGDIMIVQLTSDVIQTVRGVPVTLIQWPEHGGMQIHLKIMAIQLPRCRADFNGSCGILHATQVVASP